MEKSTLLKIIGKATVNRETYLHQKRAVVAYLLSYLMELPGSF
jgi:hypothetical protein